MKENTQGKDWPLIGRVVGVEGPVVKIKCENLLPIHQALTIKINAKFYYLEVYQHVDIYHIKAILLHESSGLY